jgi:uncharacterized protein YkwD
MSMHTRHPLFAAIAAAALLAGCGGGGSDSPAPASTGTGTGTPSPGTPSTQGIGTYAAGSAQASAFQQVNSARTRCGWSALSQAAELDRSATAHANYMAANNSYAHEEVPGKPGFTGAQVWDRESAAGYNWSLSGEVLAQVASNRTGGDAIRELLAVPYHAVLLLGAFRDIGLGWSTVAGFQTLTADLGRRQGQAAPAPAGVATYPCNGITDAVPVAGNEVPSPFPSSPSTEWGQAITVIGPTDLALNGASVTGPTGSVQILAIYGTGQAVDPNNTGDFQRGAFTIIPAPLAANTSYSVTIDYTTGGAAGRRDFAFSTASR